MKQQIAFILKLRGISALLVMVYHYCHFFWMNQDFCGRLANHSPVTDVPWIAKFLESLPINLGNLGVAVFFLISGFLMPIVAQNKTRLEFIKRRIWRIWPTYVMALLLTMLLVYLSSKNNQQALSFPWSIDHIAASLFLVRDIGGYPFIDGIVWTLEIEIKFYLLCCIAHSWLVEKPTKFILLIVGLFLLSFVLVECKDFAGTNYIGINHVEIFHIERLLQLFFKTMKFICFMGLGCLLSYFYQGKITKRKAFIYSVVLGSLYFGYFVYVGNHAAQWKEIASYGLAYLLFIGCYMLKKKFLNQGIMAYMGKISYSLYLVHGVPGFVVMYWMMNQGIQPIVAITAAIFCLLLGANVFYLVIEKMFVRSL